MTRAEQSRSGSGRASVADVVAWSRVVPGTSLVMWVCDTRTSIRREFLTFPMDYSDWRVGSKISDFSTVWSSWKS